MNAQRRIPKAVLLGTVAAVLGGAGVYSYYAFFAPAQIQHFPVPPQAELVSTASFYCNDVDLLQGATAVVRPVTPLRLKATFTVRDRKRFSGVSESFVSFVRIFITDQRGVIQQGGLGTLRREGDRMELTVKDIPAPTPPGEYTIRLIAAQLPTRDDGGRLTSQLLCEGKLRVSEAASGGS